MNEQMTPEQRIDAALDAVLRAAGSRLAYYMPETRVGMREAMRTIMSNAYIAGVHSEQQARAQTK